MDELPPLLNTFIFSAMFFWLRKTIDQQKGFIVEVIAVTAPVAIAGICSYGYAFESVQTFGARLYNLIAVEFLSLPLFVALRLVERLSNHEQLQLADIFRTTTITALATFVIRLLELETENIGVVLCMTLAFIIGDKAATASPSLYRLATVVTATVGFMVLSTLSLYLQFSPTPFFGSQYYDSYLPISVSIPFLWHHLFNHWIRLERIGHYVEAIRMSQTHATEAIYHRTLFRLWSFRKGVCFLNHGSFGAVPLQIQWSQRLWQDECAKEPMDILARKMELGWQNARDRLAYWLATKPENLALCENATVGMNEIAGWFPLEKGDEVLLTDHEYGAVKRSGNEQPSDAERRWQQSSCRCHSIKQKTSLNPFWPHVTNALAWSS